MKNLNKIGNAIRNKRLSMNLTMGSVASKVGITRATLSSLENGATSCSIETLMNVLNELAIEIEFKNIIKEEVTRNRATRTNTKLDKKINSFVIMCVEQYAESIGESGSNVYLSLEEKGIIQELENDYEDLHGMSTVYLNEYIDALRRKGNA